MHDINEKLIHIHQGLVLCPFIFHLFCFSVPYQLIPLLKLCPHFLFNILLLVYFHLIKSF